ncbi:Uncharacterised protein [Salmonella enterica subsp. enterica]|uniref:Uncharacterized protein n=1 Tax=Salmonella enterica I TaxID=59201 RepID=A0A447N9D4_SALET|nr:Uncharacterised protein [Salmonella enterica subsp. enterica]
MLNIYFDYLYAVIKFSRPGHTEMGNEPYIGDSPVVCFTDMPIASLFRDWCSPIRTK